MGQRLAITVVNNGDEQGLLFFKWSGYTFPAIKEITRIINKWNNSRKSKDSLDTLKLLFDKELGIRYSPESIPFLKNKFGLKKRFITNNADSSRGIIIPELRDMEDVRCFSEMSVWIDFDAEVIDITDIFFGEADGSSKYQSVLKSSLSDPFNVSFNEFLEFANELDQNYDAIQLKNGQIFLTYQ